MEPDPLDPAQVRACLTELRRADPELQTFGARRHRYTLGLPLPEAQVRALEKLAGFSVPADYRHFVTRVGNGGAGPFYGLNPLMSAASPTLDRLARPFLPPTSWGEYEEGEAPEDGVLELCDVGCGLVYGLACSGPEAGHIFYRDEVNWLPTFPGDTALWREAGSHERAVRRVFAEFAAWPRHTFASWYGEWLRGPPSLGWPAPGERSRNPGSGSAFRAGVTLSPCGPPS